MILRTIVSMTLNAAERAMKIAAVLFDLDGTLVDTLSICYDSFRNAVVGSGGPSLTDVEIHDLFGPSEDGMMQQVPPSGWQDAER